MLPAFIHIGIALWVCDILIIESMLNKKNKNE